MKKITPKQQRFADEWLIDLNSTRAATRAGYSAKTANEQGARLLANISVQEYIAVRMKARQERTEITQDFVLRTIQDTIDRCRQAKPVIGRKGEQVMVEAEDGALVPAFTFDANSVLRGCELLGKHLGIFAKDNTQKRPYENLSDQELLALMREKETDYLASLANANRKLTTCDHRKLTTLKLRR
jgi:phage terminase small subunit